MSRFKSQAPKTPKALSRRPLTVAIHAVLRQQGARLQPFGYYDLRR